MENRFPLFQGGRILKKESLWDVRDYAYGGWQIYYRDYTDGILNGCKIRVEEEELVVEPGMIKYQDFIYMMQKETRIPYRANDQWVALKIRFEKEEGHLDYLLYSMEFFIDSDLNREEGQLELCRFYLRRGSWLRDVYKGFQDMSTEYDTVNLIHASVAGRGQAAMHPGILLQFAEDLSTDEEKEPSDYAFCYEIWNTSGWVSREMIAAYLLDKNRGEDRKEICGWDNVRIYEELENVLSRRSQKRGQGYGRKVIYVE